MSVKNVQIILDGNTYTLALNPATGKYEKQVTAPARSSFAVNGGHYYPITVQAVDDAGNMASVDSADSLLGDRLRIRVRETVPPVITIISPTDEEITGNRHITVTWTVTDNDSGVAADSMGITVDGGSRITGGISRIAITGGFKCSYTISTDLPDGTHTVCVDAEDNDGNSAVQRSATFIQDTVPPALSVSSPVNNLITNSRTVNVSGETSDTTSSPCSVTVSVNGKSSIIPVGDKGAFSSTVELGAGVNTIIITSTDSGGTSSSTTRTVTLDSNAPVISDISVSPNPVSTGNLFTVSLKVTD